MEAPREKRSKKKSLPLSLVARASSSMCLAKYLPILYHADVGEVGREARRRHFGPPSSPTDVSAADPRESHTETQEPETDT